MAFTSYAQNFEDLALWRSLRTFGPGYYIDVGANHPTHHSVTRTLYERGWRGINIEPVSEYHQALVSERPEDVNLCMAAGERNETLTLHEVADTGLSTLNGEVAERNRQLGMESGVSQVPVRRLADICEEYLREDRPLHFLKIDVEGFEEQVLRGMDFQRWRPWIILLESPFDQVPYWEHLLLEAGYQFAQCDALNRFYVADEKAILKNPLSLPPSVLDDVQVTSAHFLMRNLPDISQLQCELDTQRERAELAERELQALRTSRRWKLAGKLARLAGR
jgi:FkbM family methyltransferase